MEDSRFDIQDQNLPNINESYSKSFNGDMYMKFFKQNLNDMKIENLELKVQMSQDLQSQIDIFKKENEKNKQRLGNLTRENELKEKDIEQLKLNIVQINQSYQRRIEKMKSELEEANRKKIEKEQEIILLRQNLNELRKQNLEKSAQMTEEIQSQSEILKKENEDNKQKLEKYAILKKQLLIDKKSKEKEILSLRN